MLLAGSFPNLSRTMAACLLAASLTISVASFHLTSLFRAFSLLLSLLNIFLAGLLPGP